MDVTRLKIDFKTAALIIGTAWTPAFAIGGGMVKWGLAMDHRVTVQEQVNIKLSETLVRMEQTQATNVTTLISKVESLQIKVAQLEASK